MSIQPTRTLERKAYAGIIFTWMMLVLSGVSDSIMIAMALSVLVWAIFKHLRPPQTAEQESLDALDFTSLNLASQPAPRKLKDQP